MAAKIQYLKTNELPDDKKTAAQVLTNIDEFFLETDGVLYHLYEPTKSSATGIYKQLVLPKKFRSDILFWEHDHPMASHIGFVKTLERIRRRYYWPLMVTEINNWIKTCIHCAQKKGSPKKNKGATFTNACSHSLGTGGL